MKEDWLEDKMKERFEGFDSGLNLEEAWGDLEARRNPEKTNRKGLIWWWTAAAGGIILLAGLFFVNLPYSAQGSIVSAENTEQEMKQNTNGSITQSVENQIIVEEKTEEQSVSSPVLKNNENVKSEYFQKEKASEKENINTKKESSVELTRKNSIANKALITKYADYRKKDSNSSENLSSFPTYSANESEVIDINFLKQDYVSLLENQIGLLKQVEIIPTDISNFYQINKLVDDKDGKSKTLKNTIGLSYNFGKAFRETPRGRSNSNYTILRDKAEKNLDAWSAQLFFERKIKEDWFLRFDVGYVSVTDSYIDEAILTTPKMFDNQVLQINRFIDGTESQVVGEALGSQTQTTTNTFYQRYRSSFIGFAFGRKFDLASSFTFRASAGADLTIFRNNQGVIADPTETSDEYDNLSNFSSQKGSFLAGKVRFELGKTIGKSHEISLGLVGRADLTDVKNHPLYVGRRQFLFGELTYRKFF